MKKLSLLLLAAVALPGLAACRGQTSHDTPVFGIRNMYDQPKYDIQEESDFEGFSDHRTMRPLPEGVVAADQETNPEIAFGRLEDESGYVMTIPPAVAQRFGGAEQMVARGKERFHIYCSPCHDNTGSGEGLVKRRAVAGGAAAFAPPTFHQDRLRHAPDGQIFATITNGKSNMPPYAMQIKVDDRWAIVSYVRALQVAGPKMAAPAVAPTTIPGATATPPPGGTIPTPPGSNAGVPGAGGSVQVPPPPAGSGPHSATPGIPSGSAGPPPTMPTGAPNAMPSHSAVEEKKP
jgi:mono/diheme cytochrome c family protein